MPDIAKQLEAHLNSQGISGVKVHTAAGKVATAMGARAFSRGESIIFASFVNDPTTAPLGHELVHVIQQREGKPSLASEADAMATGAKVKRDAGGLVKAELEQASGGGETGKPSSTELRQAVEAVASGK